MNTSKKRIGAFGESIAVQHLQKHGYKIIDRNVHVGNGELDIVARKEKMFVFVEVKTRKSEKYVDVWDTIDTQKAENLENTCDEYLSRNNFDEYDFRIDLIGIILWGTVVKKIHHIKGII